MRRFLVGMAIAAAFFVAGAEPAGAHHQDTADVYALARVFQDGGGYYPDSGERVRWRSVVVWPGVTPRRHVIEGVVHRRGVLVREQVVPGLHGAGFRSRPGEWVSHGFRRSHRPHGHH